MTEDAICTAVIPSRNYLARCAMSEGHNGPHSEVIDPPGRIRATWTDDAIGATYLRCICGEPRRVGTVHRLDGPCWIDEEHSLAASDLAAIRAVQIAMSSSPLEAVRAWSLDLAAAIETDRP